MKAKTKPKPEAEYVQFGDEWRREVMKLPKAQIVEILRDACMQNMQSTIYGQPPKPPKP